MITQPNTPKTYLALYQDGWTKGYQLAMEDETGSGFRLAGPKFNGSGKIIQRCEIDARAADEIRTYLDRSHPPTP